MAKFSKVPGRLPEPPDGARAWLSELFRRVKRLRQLGHLATGEPVAEAMGYLLAHSDLSDTEADKLIADLFGGAG